jgi:hypothetical protein
VVIDGFENHRLNSSVIYQKYNYSHKESLMLNTTNLANLHNLHPGKMHLASSQGRQEPSGAFAKVLGSDPGKMVEVPPGETFVLAEIPGPGQIVRIWMTNLNLPFAEYNFNHYGLLRFYWDGEQTPSVEVPFGDFFGVPWGNYKHYISEPLSCTSGGYNCYFPMPFSQGCRVEVVNQAPVPWRMLFFQIQYLALPEQPIDLRFHAQWRRENPTQEGVPYRILEAEGQGHFAGVHMFMQNAAQWFDPGRMLQRYQESGELMRAVFPEMLGMGILEGWERISVDDEPEPSVTGTGTEDYFNSGFYFLNGTYSAPYWGCTVRSYLTSRCAAYRFHVLDPISFQKNIRVDIDHGYTNHVPGDYRSVAYWYQFEPHGTFPVLPPVDERLPGSVTQNALQFALMTSPLWVPAGLASLRLLTRRRKR